MRVTLPAMLPPADRPLPERIWIYARAHPLEMAGWLVLAGVITWFYGFLPKYGPDGVFSTLGILASSWNDETDYRHGYLIPPLMVALLAWKFWKQGPGPREFHLPGLWVFLLGVVLFVLAARMGQWRMAAGSLPVVVWGALWHGFGWRTARASALPVFLLWFAIPVPGMVQATNGLQVLATQFGYWGAKMFGIDVLLSGSMIQSAVADKWDFDIAEGCSGIRSLMAMVLIAAVYVYMIDLPLWRKVVVFAMALPLAILVNAVRITSIILLAEFMDPDFAAGIYHDWASFFIFPMGLLGMLAAHQLLTIDRRVRRRVVRRRSAPAANPATPA